MAENHAERTPVPLQNTHKLKHKLNNNGKRIKKLEWEEEETSKSKDMH